MTGLLKRAPFCWIYKPSQSWLKTAFKAIIALIFLWYFSVFARIVAYIWINPDSTAFQRLQMSELEDENPKIQKRQQWVDYDKISPALKKALIAAEDAKFNDHDGFDWDGIEQAFDKNLSKGKIVAGGSTISQQLAKNLFLSPSRNPLRKIDEAIITVMLETLMDKQRIFEIYLNVIEWGEGIYGAEAAAKYYFNTSAKRLNTYQAAYLAAMVPNPRYYQDHRSTRHLQWKTSILLKRLKQSDIPD